MASDDALNTDEVWITNRKRIIMLMVVFIASMSLPYFRFFNESLPNTHPAIVALLNGGIAAVVAYFPMIYADPKYGFANAIMIGLLVAEFTTYGSPIGFPTPVVISFFFFMFYVGESEAAHLWPCTYANDCDKRGGGH